MKESIDFYKAKKLMENMNIIIYGTIRNIEKYFSQSFTNLEILASYFKKTFIIIFENDSTDSTRDSLITWLNSNKLENIVKFIILEDNLDQKYPLRATRLAYCRNKILDFIFQNNYDKEYEYAIHCDLDNRFWEIDYNSVCNSFQYPLDKWDVMTSVSRNKKYYDYWALRVENCWFNKNIFSCEAEWPETNFETKTHEFIDILKKTNNLLSCTSSFNGLGIYKLSSMKNSRYSSIFECKECNGLKQGCWEDNDHIGLHKSMIENNCSIFINTKMNLFSKPDNALFYDDYIRKYFFLIPNLNLNPLLYLLKNNLISKTYLWLDFDTSIGEVVNILSNYNNNIYSFPLQNVNYTLLNKNITIVNGKKDLAINIFTNKFLKNDYISFIHLNTNDYFTVKYIFSQLITKIDNSCIILFNYFINYIDYKYNSFKAFFEISQEYQLEFETIGVNGIFDLNSNSKLDIEMNESSDCIYNNKIVAIKIINNPSKNHHKIIPKKYLSEYEIMDINNIGFFDWNLYIYLNPDLDKEILINKNKVWEHWSIYGYLEDRYFYFDLQKCIQENNLPKNTTYTEAINNCSNYKKYCIKFNFNEKKNNELIKKYKTELFDWEFYINSHNDLKKLNTYEKAWNHYLVYGENENRITNNFNWLHYLILNQDLDLFKLENLNEEIVLNHYINIGMDEKRKFNIT